LELEVSNWVGANAGNVSGTITITRQSGEVLVSAATLILGRRPDDPGVVEPVSRRLSFGMEAAQVATPLREGEALQGTVTVTFGGRRFDLTLPQASLVFTH
jgi:hypothetical protein